MNQLVMIYSTGLTADEHRGKREKIYFFGSDLVGFCPIYSHLVLS